MMFAIHQQEDPVPIHIPNWIMGDGRVFVHTFHNQFRYWTGTFLYGARRGDYTPEDEAGTIMAASRHSRWSGRRSSTVTASGQELAKFVSYFKREPAPDSPYRDEDNMRLWRIPSLQPEWGEPSGYDLVAPAAIYGNYLFAHVEDHREPFSREFPKYYFGYFSGGGQDGVSWRNFQKIYEGFNRGDGVTSAIDSGDGGILLYHYSQEGVQISWFEPENNGLFAYNTEQSRWLRRTVSPTNEIQTPLQPVLRNVWYPSVSWCEYLGVWLMVANTNFHNTDHSVWLFHSDDKLHWQTWGQLMAPADRYYYPSLVSEDGMSMDIDTDTAYLFYQQEDDRLSPPRANGRQTYRRKIIFNKPVPI